LTKVNDQTSYLDYNASAPLRPAVAEAMKNTMLLAGNPSSVHTYGRFARKQIDDARDLVAATVGADPTKLVFTSGGTEANNLALAGAGRTIRLVSDIEHDSVLAAAPEAIHIPVDQTGVVNTAALDELLAKQNEPTLVSVMMANNETGVIQPLTEVISIAHNHNALVHCDAVQALGKLAIDMASLEIDLMTLSAHKIGGPKGIGALALRSNVEIEAQLVGGGQEGRRRAGTENVAAAVGFAEACVEIKKNENEIDRMLHLRNRFEELLRNQASNIEIFGHESPRLVNTCCLRLPGRTSETQVIALDLAGIAVSAGAACSSGKVTSSHVLTAMGVSPSAANESIRVSLGWATTENEIEHAADAWLELYNQTEDRPRRTTE